MVKLFDCNRGYRTSLTLDSHDFAKLSRSTEVEVNTPYTIWDLAGFLSDRPYEHLQDEGNSAILGHIYDVVEMNNNGSFIQYTKVSVCALEDQSLFDDNYKLIAVAEDYINLVS